MQKIIVLCLTVAVALAVLGCSGPAPMDDADSRTDSGELVVRFGEGVTLQEVAHFAAFGRERSSVRCSVRYRSHRVDVNLNLDEEVARLEGLRGRFSKQIEIEDTIRRQIDGDLANLRNGTGPLVDWCLVPSKSLLDLEDRFELSVIAYDTAQELDDTRMYQSALSDYSDDPVYVPLGGTSTIYAEGSLQKFWLDRSADQVFTEAEDGLEIAVVPVSDVDCAMSGFASNLPDNYAGDWSFDFGYAKSCRVGTINAQALRPNVLYWTWHPFRSFLTAHDPEFTIMYRPMKRCLWIQTNVECSIFPYWCMCRRDDLPPQPLVGYHWSEAPGHEVPWWRN